MKTLQPFTCKAAMPLHVFLIFFNIIPTRRCCRPCGHRRRRRYGHRSRRCSVVASRTGVQGSRCRTWANFCHAPGRRRAPAALPSHAAGSSRRLGVLPIRSRLSTPICSSASLPQGRTSTLSYVPNRKKPVKNHEPADPWLRSDYPRF